MDRCAVVRVPLGMREDVLDESVEALSLLGRELACVGLQLKPISVFQLRDAVRQPHFMPPLSVNPWFAHLDAHAP